MDITLTDEYGNIFLTKFDSITIDSKITFNPKFSSEKKHENEEKKSFQFQIKCTHISIILAYDSCKWAVTLDSSETIR